MGKPHWSHSTLGIPCRALLCHPSVVFHTTMGTPGDCSPTLPEEPFPLTHRACAFLGSPQGKHKPSVSTTLRSWWDTPPDLSHNSVQRSSMRHSFQRVQPLWGAQQTAAQTLWVSFPDSALLVHVPRGEPQQAQPWSPADRAFLGLQGVSSTVMGPGR